MRVSFARIHAHRTLLLYRFAEIEQVQSTVNRIVRLIEVLKPGSTELVAGEAPLRFPLPPADMERLETADPSSHLRQVFVSNSYVLTIL